MLRLQVLTCMHYHNIHIYVAKKKQKIIKQNLLMYLSRIFNAGRINLLENLTS